MLEPICSDVRRQSLPSAERFPPLPAVTSAPVGPLGPTGTVLFLEAPESVSLGKCHCGGRGGEAWAGHGGHEGCCNPCTDQRTWLSLGDLSHLHPKSFLKILEEKHL